MNHRRVEPLRGPLDAVVTVPGSKSLANRALVCAALAAGESVLGNVPDGDDTAAMLDCLRALGLAVAAHDGTVRVHGGPFAPGPARLQCRLAGTTSRFVTALAALGPGPYTVDGDAPLRARPMADLHQALVALGLRVEPAGEPGHLPVVVGGRTAPEPARPARVTVRGDVSSQYLSALMMIGPYLPGGLTVELAGELVSRPYVELTAAVMAAFGHDGVHVGTREVHVEQGEYRPCAYTVEADASSAVYPLAAAAAVGGRVRVEGLGAGSLQADARFADVLAAMGATVERGADFTEVRGSGELRGVEVDLRDFSDCAPTVAVLATLAQSPTAVTGIGFIRAKESDRIGDVVGELRRCGADATAQPDGFSVRPAPLHGATVQTHHDHRIAMSFAVLGLVVPGVEIEDPGVVSKSYPGFWGMLEQLRRGSAPVAAFDVDGTLTTRDSVVPYLRRVAGGMRLALTVARHPLLAITTALGRGDRDRLKEAVVGPLVRGRRREELDEIGRRYAHEVLAHRTRADTVARLAWHREQGHRVVLVSASLRSYLEPFARDVLGGVDAVLCTDVEVDREGVCTGRLAGHNCRGPEKVRRLAAWLGTDGRVAWAYGDSSGDEELLDAATYPVRVGTASLATVPDREPA